ncbi:hypothetical protein BCON_0057g00160 [Botryotinia convoluta]|uniref:O-methyltransferase domain-containing protein n=1 Tax=Botryotinia convoluta TaxID=54673 RepID=A0A4Z1IGG8_9HELO|nr:hypothetical protein BCON_0057g00160 [Botryotinia convoluta]
MLFWTPKLVISYNKFEAPHGLKLHGFHNRQPIGNADAYLSCWFKHNHNSSRAETVQRQLKPGLKKGARLLVNDYCLTEARENQAGLKGKAMRTTDINMLANLNTRETESDWVELFDEVKGFGSWV